MANDDGQLIGGYMRYTTIKKECSLLGYSQHGRNFCRITFSPATAGTGIQFIYRGETFSREDWTQVKSRIVLRKSNGVIRNVEPVYSAIGGLGITDLLVELENADEPPYFDGLVWPFVKYLLAAGIKTFQRDGLVIDCIGTYAQILSGTKLK